MCIYKTLFLSFSIKIYLQKNLRFVDLMNCHIVSELFSTLKNLYNYPWQCLAKPYNFLLKSITELSILIHTKSYNLLPKIHLSYKLDKILLMLQPYYVPHSSTSLKQKSVNVSMHYPMMTLLSLHDEDFYLSA